MPKLPDAYSLDVATPRSDRPLVSYNPNQVYDAAEKAGEKITKAVGDYQSAQNKIEYTYAKSNLLQGIVGIKDELASDQDYTTYQSRFTQKNNDLVKQSAEMIKNPAIRQQFMAEAGLLSRSGLSDILGMARTKEKEYGQASSLDNFDKNIKAAVNTRDTATGTELLHTANEVIDAAVAKGYYTPLQGYEAKKRGAAQYGEAWLAQKPYDEQLKLLQNPAQSAKNQDFSVLDTKLSPAKEQEFQAWKAEYAPKDSGRDYDLRGAFLKGYTPDAKSGHFPDEFKKPNHPTFSDQSKFAKDYPNLAGKWEGEKYIPPKSAGGGFDSAIQSVFKNEGGYTAVDGSSGAPAIYGINAKWHPEAYQKAKELTDTKGEDAGKQYAQEFYKSEYWDKNKLDNLPPESQAIVMDGLVNHTSGFGKKLVKAAQEGATPDELIQMRKGEYNRLVEANPAKYENSADSWNNRLDTISKPQASDAKNNTPLDFIPFEKKQELLRSAHAALKADIELRDKDPMTYAQAHGITPDEPLNFSTPQVLGTQLQNRAAAATGLHQNYGAPLKVMTDEEAKHLSNYLEEAPTDAKLVQLKNFRDSLGDNQLYQAALQQIRPDSPVTAMAGEYLGLDKRMKTATHWFKPDESISAESVAEHLVQGEDLLNPTKATKKDNGTGRVFPMPSDSSSGGLRVEFNSYAGDVFRGHPQLADQAYQAVRAYYAAEAAKQGDYTGQMNSDIAELANKAVLGNVVDKNGKKVLAPWGMDESAFLDQAKNKFDGIVRREGYSPNIVNWNEIGLENTGEPNRYRAVVGNGYLLDKKRNPVVIDLSPYSGPQVPQPVD